MTKVIILDAGEKPDKIPVQDGEILLLWNSYQEARHLNRHSLPLYLETHARFLRSLYLEWIYSLGEAKLQGRRIVDILSLGRGFSLWWMNPLVEKCNYDKSPWINDAIKLIALDIYLSEFKINSVEVISPRIDLFECLESLCALKKIPIGVQRAREVGLNNGRYTLRAVYKRVPAVIRGFVWFFRHVSSRWQLRGVGVRKWKSTQATYLFVSYLLNLDPFITRAGRFRSSYWANLPDKLNDQGVSTNWLHIFVPNALVPTSRDAAKLLGQMNSVDNRGQTHVSLHSFMTLEVLYRTIIGWVRGRRLAKPIENVFSKTGINGVSLWPLFKREWRESVTGPTALSNQLYINLFNEAIRLLPFQRNAVYLQENMDWEYAFLFAWRSAGHGRAIGYPHATVRFWDLRYFSDPRAYDQSHVNSMPVPDLIALNGDVAVDEYRMASYPMERIVRVEGLRYLHLLESKRFQGIRSALRRPRLLVLLDYSRYRADTLLKFICNALLAPELESTLDIIVKPHISTPVNSNLYEEHRFIISSEPLNSLLSQCDIVLTGIATSSAVEAYCYGLPVLVLLDESSLNLSALRNVSGVRFIAGTQELVAAIKAYLDSPVNTQEPKPFFLLDLDIPAWMNLLTNGPNRD